jgi:hypothetical protein
MTNHSSARTVFKLFQGADSTSIWPEEKRLRVTVPDGLIGVGDAILVWYISDKVLDDTDGSTMESYEHEFGRGVKLYYDDRLWDDGTAYSLRVPHVWTLLGVCEGWAFRRADTGAAKEVRIPDGILLWDEESRSLGLMQGHDLLGIITGGRLRLTRYGIEG